jgi:DNA-binding IclR family transcriptional regulator
MQTTRETVHLVVYDHGEVVYIDKVESPNTIRMFSQVGRRNPAYCTAVGKAFLAYLPEAAFDEVVARGLTHRTDNTRTTPEALRADLELIRQRGYAVDDIENEPEVRCVGAPIFDYSGRAIAAASVSGPATRVTGERVPELGRVVKGATEKISERLGFRRHS